MNFASRWSDTVSTSTITRITHPLQIVHSSSSTFLSLRKPPNVNVINRLVKLIHNVEIGHVDTSQKMKGGPFIWDRRGRRNMNIPSTPLLDWISEWNLAESNLSTKSRWKIKHIPSQKVHKWTFQYRHTHTYIPIQLKAQKKRHENRYNQHQINNALSLSERETFRFN